MPSGFPNIILVRGEPIPDGAYHLVCEIIVKHTDNTYLLMRRDRKKHRGGMWELTAGGAAVKGEPPLMAANRELKEETGIESQTLKEMKRIVHEKHQSLYIEYLCVTNCKKDAITLQEGETIEYKWVDRNFLLEIDEQEMAAERTLQLMKELGI